MKYRVIAFALLALSFSLPSHAVFFAGELTTSDELAEDIGFGDFYYDLYYVTVDAPMEIEIFMDPIDAFAPWIGYWDGDFSATPDYDTPIYEDSKVPAEDDELGDQLYLKFDALPGIQYQIMAATFNYNPTDLGVYDFFIVDPDRTDEGFMADDSPIMVVQQVPAPASWVILIAGLIALRVLKRPVA